LTALPFRDRNGIIVLFAAHQAMISLKDLETTYSHVGTTTVKVPAKKKKPTTKK
jgi:hypothetical protein